MARDTLSSLADLTRQLCRNLTAKLPCKPGSRWAGHHAWFAQRTGSTDLESFADAVSQAIACARFGLQAFGSELQSSGAVRWLIAGSDALISDVLRIACNEKTPPMPSSVAADMSQPLLAFLDEQRVSELCDSLPRGRSTAEAVVYYYEQFLATYDRQSRRRKGVFYTPHRLVAFVVRSVDELLREEFGLPNGLADTSSWSQLRLAVAPPVAEPANDDGGPFVKLLDPAMGTGAFLLEAMSAIRTRFVAQMLPAESDTTEQTRLWNHYVSHFLLPRVCGHELMLAPLVMAHITATVWLADTGFDFETPGKFQFNLANTLQSPDAGLTHASEDIGFTLPLGGSKARNEPSGRVDESLDRVKGPASIILGNPPFSGVSENRQAWLRELMRGRYRVGRQPVADYFSACGEPLGERKHWLEDDYVKFMRFAHWQIELSGAGIVALVTNHGYLDNSTFRGMRESLLNDFPRIALVDLHGNTRNGERAPDNSLNESVFGIEQGVAVGLFRRPLGKTEMIRAHADVWGSAEAKLRTLSDSSAEPLIWTQFHPAPPYFFLKPMSDDRWHEYQAGHRLCDIMPVNSTAAVTARDSFVIAFDQDELKARLREFADPEVSDEEIRRKYFGNTRSTKYRAGDTRGWKVAEARQRLGAEPKWERHIRPCMYRPFDRREIFWTPWMIDWPRHEVMSHLLSQENLALIARRQMPPAQPCSYFWVSDTIAVDGLIRSDNRGSESVFPLYLDRSEGDSQQQTPNFTDTFLEQCESQLGMTCQLTPHTGEKRAFTPRELFDYIYALFHCPSYRRRFDELLRIDFPRVLLPREPELFFSMSHCGQRLISAHLLQRTDQRSAWRRSGLASASCQLGRGYPRYKDQTIWLNADTGFAEVEPAIWEFRVGTYQVCRKWLKDRRHRGLSPRELVQYGQILNAIDETIRVISGIERLLAQHGGWEQSFM